MLEDGIMLPPNHGLQMYLLESHRNSKSTRHWEVCTRMRIPLFQVGGIITTTGTVLNTSSLITVLLAYVAVLFV